VREGRGSSSLRPRHLPGMGGSPTASALAAPPLSGPSPPTPLSSCKALSISSHSHSLSPYLPPALKSRDSETRRPSDIQFECRTDTRAVFLYTPAARSESIRARVTRVRVIRVTESPGASDSESIPSSFGRFWAASHGPSGCGPTREDGPAQLRPPRRQ
jgi:hypothetical protein